MSAIEVDDEEVFKEQTLAETTFAWEDRYTQSWEIVKEDEHGTLQPTLAVLLQRESEYLSKRRLAADKVLRRGIMRNMVILIDWSVSSASTDVTPNRGCWIINHAVRLLVREFFEQNPLSQICLLSLCDGVAVCISELSSNSTQHDEALQRHVDSGATDGVPSGSFSLQNGLEVSKSILNFVPGHGTREILLFQVSMGSQDPENIFDQIPSLCDNKIRFSAISIYGEVAMIKRLARDTGGTYNVALNDANFIELSREQLTPPILLKDSKTTSYLVLMGFPKKINQPRPVLCACHSLLRNEGFQCPRCQCFVCQIPSDCPICHLTLLSAPHLARSYHHLFPPATYIEVDDITDVCSGCKSFIDATRNMEGFRAGRCRRCNNDFCASCNHLVHTSLFNCPSCML